MIDFLLPSSRSRDIAGLVGSLLIAFLTAQVWEASVAVTDIALVADTRQSAYQRCVTRVTPMLEGVELRQDEIMAELADALGR